MPRPPGRPGSLLPRWFQRWRASTDAPTAPQDVPWTGAGEGLSTQTSTLQGLIEHRRGNALARDQEFAQLRAARQSLASPGARSAPASATGLQRPVPAAGEDPAQAATRAGTLRKIAVIEAEMAGPWALASSALPTDPPSDAAPWADPRPGPAMEVAEIIQDPDIEEAAIRYASGDLPGAQSLLQALIEPARPRATEPQVWLALFDFLVATGQAAAHEALALAYAERVGRSAPPWRQMVPAVPQGEGPLGAPAVPPRAGAGGATALSGAASPCWVSPAVVGRPEVDTLAAAVQARPAGPAARVVWSALERIEDEAAGPLADVLAAWARQPVLLDLVDHARLLQVLARATPVQDPSVPPQHWALRLQALRLVNQAEAFEATALDYCLTYERSPPPWEPPRCRCVQPVGPQARAVPLAAEPATPPALLRPSLTGNVVGDGITQQLAALEALAGGAADGPLVIDCTDLARIDFAAASALLNWVQARATEGQGVEFIEVHRLVAGLLHVMGLGQLACIRLVHD